jgi:hypothetical protein
MDIITPLSDFPDRVITTSVVIKYDHQIGQEAHKQGNFMKRQGIFLISCTKVGREDLGKSS